MWKLLSRLFEETLFEILKALAWWLLAYWPLLATAAASFALALWSRLHQSAVWRERALGAMAACIALAFLFAIVSYVRGRWARRQVPQRIYVGSIRPVGIDQVHGTNRITFVIEGFNGNDSPISIEKYCEGTIDIALINEKSNAEYDKSRFLAPRINIEQSRLDDIAPFADFSVIVDLPMNGVIAAQVSVAMSERGHGLQFRLSRMRIRATANKSGKPFELRLWDGISCRRGESIGRVLDLNVTMTVKATAR